MLFCLLLYTETVGTVSKRFFNKKIFSKKYLGEQVSGNDILGKRVIYCFFNTGTF